MYVLKKFGTFMSPPHPPPIISLSLTFSPSLHVFTYRQCLSDCRYIYMDFASLAAKAELHALPAPLAPYLEPTTTDRTPPNHYLHAGRKGRKVVGMSQASATGATVEPWADQTVSVSIKLTVSRSGYPCSHAFCVWQFVSVLVGRLLVLVCT